MVFEKRTRLNFKTYKCITLLDFALHLTPFHPHGSESSGLHLGRLSSELRIDALKLIRASPVCRKNYIYTGLKCSN